jgi:hypothetical protein
VLATLVNQGFFSLPMASFISLMWTSGLGLSVMATILPSRPMRKLIRRDKVGENRIGATGPTCYLSAVSITAKVEEGKIVLPANNPWPSGTLVRIEPVEESSPTLWETLKEFDGMADDMPADLATNLDHYVHGHPRS